MACITKLANAIAYDCDSGSTGLVSALIINKADIASFSLTSDSTGLLSIATTGPGKMFKIDTFKRSATASATLKVNEGAPNAFTHSVTLTVTDASEFVQSVIAQAISNGSFVVLAKRTGGRCLVYGLYYGLSATAYERSTHDNGGWATITLETPENVMGEDIIYTAEATYDALYAAAVG